ncbi:MAG: hypothetical protein JSW49_00480 [candidate division WOR-3 bacterium]|nr:MAG: hypothetical protein JSW49_00480 [candidate division WOR-3 bacterium]
MSATALLFLFGWLNWKTLKSDDFTVIYRDAYYCEALHTLENLQYYKDNTEDLIGEYGRNLPVVIEDVGAISNGFANPFFGNVHLFTYPPGFAYRLQGIESWYRTLAVHEYAHILHLRRVGGVPAFLTSIFGPLFAPNIYSPGWITEGVTVLVESRNSPYEGRLNDGFFDACIGSRVQASDMPSIVEATNAPLDFPAGTYYLYGGEFFNFLVNEYGADKLSEFFSIYGEQFWAPLSGVFPYAGLDKASRQAFGKSWPSLFDQWCRYEQGRFQDWEPASIRSTAHGWYVYSIEAGDDMLYYVRSEPVKVDAFGYRSVTYLVEFDCGAGTERTIAVLRNSITNPLRIYDGRLYYTTPQVVSGYANVYYLGYGVVANLHVRDLSTGEDRILLTDGIRAFCVLSDGRIVYSRDRPHAFGSEIRIYDRRESTLLFETDMLVGEMDAANGRIVAVARHDCENWDVYSLDLGTASFKTIVSTPWIEGSVNLKGDTLLFTANYEGFYGVYMCDLVTGKFYRLTECGYADRGTLVGTDLYFVGISKDGFDLYMTGFAPAEYSPIAAERSPKPDFSRMDLEIREGGYGDVLRTIAPSFRLPFVLPTESDLSEWAYGLLFLGGDATDENIYGGFLAKDTEERDVIFNLLWQSRFLSPLEITFFYDHRESLDYGIAYPAYLDLEYGLSDLTLFVEGRVFDGTERCEFAPGFSVVFEYPNTTVFARLSFPYERQAWGSQINRSGQYLQSAARRIFAGGELRVLCNAYVDRNDPDTLSFSIRGYDTIETQRAAILIAEYGRRLVRVRAGLWNPNVYLEDVFWNLFADFAWTDEGTTYYSAGIELRFEVKTGLGFLQVVPKMGAAVNKSGEVRVYVGLHPRLPF